MTPDREALAIARHAIAEARRGLVAALALAEDPGVVAWLRAAGVTLEMVGRSGGRVAEVLEVGAVAVAMVEGAKS